MTTKRSTSRRAIGIIRVSQVRGREGESFRSPTEQRERIEAECRRRHLELVEVHEELDVSGGKPLSERKGLRAAVEAVEAGQASVVIAAYFDRLCRSLKVQFEVIERIEKAGGEALAVDVGEVSRATAVKKLNSSMIGAFNEYQRDVAGERVANAQRNAVASGVPPFPVLPLGYERNGTGRLIPSKDAPMVAEAFRMRANGSSVAEVTDHLRQHGIKRTMAAVQQMLKKRVVLGELSFGELVNAEAHPAIVDEEVWRAVQRRSDTRGRRAKSDRLLARQRVLRCGTCGGIMVIGTCRPKDHPQHSAIYRCPPSNECEQRVTINALMAEEIVSDHVRAALANVEGRASADANVRDAESDLQRAEDALRTTVQTLTGFEDVDGTREKLAELRQARDEAQERLDQLGGAGLEVRVNADTDWDRLTLDEQRALIRATVERATVAPGRGPERITIKVA